MLSGFKAFILRGNVIDLAVAVIIGAAFTGVVDSVVKGLVDPLLGALVGKPNFDDALNIGPLRLGLIITAGINFFLKAGVIYFFIVVPTRKLMDAAKREPQPPAAPSAQEQLLAEIRDLLKARNV
jgi:large conductance mechanosensitive channel